MVTRRTNRMTEAAMKEHCQKNYQHLSPERAIFYQDKLRHYLKSFRQRNNLSTEEMAEKLGYKSKEHYKVFEQILPNNRVIKAMNLLSFLGSLEKMDEYSFFTYLIDPPLTKRKDHMHPWESKLIKAISNIDLVTRREFSKAMIDPSSEIKQKRLERFISLILQMNRLSEEDLNAIETICKSLTERD